jgi:hypothetical protein
VGGKGRSGGQAGEMAQIMYAHMNKWINNKKINAMIRPVWDCGYLGGEGSCGSDNMARNKNWDS